MRIIIAIMIRMNLEAHMRTIQMTLDDALVSEVDRVIKRLKTSRSAFTRQALREALAKEKVKQLEAKHQSAYEKYPTHPSEFSVWEAEQEWGDL